MNKGEEKDLELVALVESSKGPTLEFELSPPTSPSSPTSNKSKQPTTQPLSLLIRSHKRKFLLVILSIISLIILSSIVHYTYIREKEVDSTLFHYYHDYQIYDNITLACPVQLRKAKNDKDEMLVEFYDELNSNTSSIIDYVASEEEEEEEEEDSESGEEEDKNEIEPQTIHIEKLKSEFYDGWEHNYNQLKDILHDWKSERFSSLNSGDRIFESGCGKGLNLLMTVEILHESKNITNIQAYGIDYVSSSTKYANDILNKILPQVGNATLGSPICRGDATNLDFVPSNSFDIAYTGYIDPIQDPLNLHIELGRDLTWDDLCVDIGTPTNKGKLTQGMVEEWYAQWVEELIRITKPGKAIIIEQVSLPTCLDSNDWGGVDKTWWHRAAKQYEWNVDVESIVLRSMYEDKKEGKRYHVYMEKLR